MTKEAVQDIEKRFTYRRPHGNQPARYQVLRDAAMSMALLVCDTCPESRERALAITSLEQVVMWANASIARNEPTAAEQDVTL